MTKAKSAKTSRTRTTKAKAPATAKASIKASASTTKAADPIKAKAVTKAKAAPAKQKADWSGAIRQALQEKQAPKTWPGGGNESWKGAPTRKN